MDNPTQILPLEVVGLTKKFGTFTAVDHVTFDVQPGEVLGYLGPNGSGKTTTIRMLCGLIKPTEGTANVMGINVFKYPEQVKPLIGYMKRTKSGQRAASFSEKRLIDSEAFKGLASITR